MLVGVAVGVGVMVGVLVDVGVGVVVGVGVGQGALAVPGTSISMKVAWARAGEPLPEAVAATRTRKSQ